MQLAYSIFESAAPLSLQHDGLQPLHLQLKTQIALQIRAGCAPTGTRLPPVRQLAEELGVNRNTVLKVYTALEQAGLVVTRVGSGTFVAVVHVDVVNNATSATRERLRQDLMNALHEGMTVHELRVVFESELGAAIQRRNARSVEVMASRRGFAQRFSHATGQIEHDRARGEVGMGVRRAPTRCEPPPCD